MIIRKSDWIRRACLVLAILISGGNLIFPRLPMLFVLAFLCLLARDWRVDFRRSLLPVFFLLTAILVVTLLRPSGVDLKTTGIRYANFFGGLLLLDLYLHAGKEALMRDIYGLGVLMAWQALITLALAKFFTFLFIPVEISETVYSTFLGLFNYHVTLDDAALRPDGLFWEPGVFQIYLCIFFYLSLFVFGKWWSALLALLAIVSTASTTGMVTVCVIAGWFGATRVVNRGSLSARIGKMFVALILIAAIGVVAAMNVRAKLSGDFQGSFWARQYDLITGINVVTEHPWFGIGFSYEEYYKASSNLGYADTELPDRITQDRSNSNGIVFLLYTIGIPLSIPFLVGMFRQRLFPDRFVTGAILFLGCTGEALIFTPFFLMFIFSGLLTKMPALRYHEVAHGV